MGILKNLEFDGVSLKDYGVGITGAGVYNAPVRDVEMVEIPGRDGGYALDKGRFKNISLSYPAGAFDTAQPDFAEKISELRNELASRVGYKRLEDEYNPDEYRMAVFKDGLEVDPVHYSRAGEFELDFECKPQRYLKSGETEQEIERGGTITNPTKFESQPLLLVDGYGSIILNGYEIDIEDEPLGEVNIATIDGTVWFGESNRYSIKRKYFMTGDAITIPSFTFELKSAYNVASLVATPSTNIDSVSTGTADGYVMSYVTTSEVTVAYANNTQIDYYLNLSVTFSDGSTTTDRVHIRISLSDTAVYVRFLNADTQNVMIIDTPFTITADSTKQGTADLHIDCDIGEAYMVDGSDIVSFNNVVQLPAELPTLKSGANTVTYDNTITSLKVIPRWWKI